MDEQLALLTVTTREPSNLADELRKVLQFAIDHKLDDVTALLRGLRDGRFILAPNATLDR